MKRLLTGIALLLGANAAGAQTCPWKVSELEPLLEQAERETAREAARLSGLDREIAAVRRAVLSGCAENKAVDQLKSLPLANPGYDAARVSEMADMLATCMAEKKVEAARRVADARAKGDSVLEQRLLRIVAQIDAIEPRSWAQSVEAGQVMSKQERLYQERDSLGVVCDPSTTDF